MARTGTLPGFPQTRYGAAMPQRMSRDEFRRWARAQPKGRYERVGGEPVPMAPERVAHIQVKTRVWQALDRAVRAAGLDCQALGDGLAVEIDADTDYEPDALVNRGPALPPDAVAATNPVVVVEVASPSIQSVDAGDKLADYFRLPSARHFLIVRTRRREVIHHERLGDRIETRIVTAGTIALDPPGIAVAIDDFYADLPS
jgi:Uma2 family endonuclease